MRIGIKFQAKSQFKRRSTANNVEIIIPVPADADSPKFKTTVGSCKYTPDQNAVVWTIKSFPVCQYTQFGTCGVRNILSTAILLVLHTQSYTVFEILEIIIKLLVISTVFNKSPKHLFNTVHVTFG